MIDKREYILSKFPEANATYSDSLHTYCPFHDDRRPSFSIDLEEGLFICGSNSCGVRGNFPLFYKLMENKSSWKEVWEDLKETRTDFNVSDLFSEKNIQYGNLSVVQYPDSSCLESIGFIDYLEERGITKDIIDLYCLSYGKAGQVGKFSLKGSIICPVWDIDGTYRTYQLRYLSKSSSKRWLNPPGSPIQHLLYGGWLLDPSYKYLWVVEGASDVWGLRKFGVQAVGLNTKEASPSQMNKIIKSCRFMNLTPIVCLDADAIVAGNKLSDELFASGLSPILVELEGEEDPGSLTKDRFNEIWRSIIND